MRHCPPTCARRWRTGSWGVRGHEAEHPDATAEKAVETIVSPLLDQLTGAVGAGDALADAVSDIMADDPESVLHTWVRRWHEALAHLGGR
jgi:hypothetical protein